MEDTIKIKILGFILALIIATYSLIKNKYVSLFVIFIFYIWIIKDVMKENEQLLIYNIAQKYNLTNAKKIVKCAKKYKYNRIATKIFIFPLIQFFMLFANFNSIPILLSYFVQSIVCKFLINKFIGYFDNYFENDYKKICDKFNNVVN